eukprot:UN27315
MKIEVPWKTKGRTCDIKITKNKMTVGLKGQDPIVEGETEAEILEHMWTLETEGSQKFLMINLTKS